LQILKNFAHLLIINKREEKKAIASGIEPMSLHHEHFSVLLKTSRKRRENQSESAIGIGIMPPFFICEFAKICLSLGKSKQGGKEKKPCPDSRAFFCVDRKQAGKKPWIVPVKILNFSDYILSTSHTPSLSLSWLRFRLIFLFSRTRGNIFSLRKGI
jgi:hypothetical protein